jgi:uncharacterized protein YbbC (DUF1343 family)/CubicO group peptidase (beta-lactamase class C family)
MAAETGLARIDTMVAEAIGRKEIPGCVVLIQHRGERVYYRAFGNRRVRPDVTPMTVDTVFDMASITKPVATATSVMILMERGKLRLADPVAMHLPEFGKNGKEEITIYQCLTHQAGLVPDSPLSEYEDPDQIWPLLCALGTVYQPGSKFVYSDVGYQVLGKLVERVAGESLDAFARKNIFEPLGMTETGFLPDQLLRNRCAPTEQRDGRWMIGEVHDPRSYAMGGVAGHAGLFSTAADLQRYARMMLRGGALRGTRVLAPSTVNLMTAAYPSGEYLRGLGWDKRSKYATNRGELFTDRAFGHGGFTGTVIWIDPGHELVVIVLSNRVHPDGSGNVNRLAGRIGTVAVAALSDETLPTSRSTERGENERGETGANNLYTGIDVVQAHQFADLVGRKIGLITNQTGCNRKGQPTSVLLHNAPNVNLVCLFSPEHGIAGKLDQANIDDLSDPATGLPVYSLYGESRSPTALQLASLDTLVFDIQDIGTRFYTYISTMGNAMQAAAEHDLQFWVLDRPNPIGGSIVAGPVLDAGRESFVGFHTLPVRHGMTIGELARMFNSEKTLGVDLQVVQIERWDRRMQWDETGLLWINPSPNMRSPEQALLYPGIGLLETTNLSVGRGTDTPFQIVGAPWIDPWKLAKRLNHQRMTGVRFIPIWFTPTTSKFAGERCGGVQIQITRRAMVQPVRLGMEFACALRDLFGDDWELERMDRLLCDARTLQKLASGAAARQLVGSYQAELADFIRRRERYLIYE